MTGKRAKHLESTDNLATARGESLDRLEPGDTEHKRGGKRTNVTQPNVLRLEAEVLTRRLSNREKGVCNAQRVLGQLVERQRLTVVTQPKPRVRSTKGSGIDQYGQ